MVNYFYEDTSHVICKHSNGERTSLANLKLTIGTLFDMLLVWQKLSCSAVLT